jgi:hypothetical protein
LYCCCSEEVASAIAIDVFRATGATLADLQDAAYPQLVEIHWKGEPVDMTVATTIVAAGFAQDYPVGVDHDLTQVAAAKWYNEGANGIVCRSASMARLGFADWRGQHEGWSEIAIYTNRCPMKPVVIRRRDDLAWLGP